MIKNKYIKYKNYIGVVLERRDGRIMGEAIVDKDDFDVIKQHRWRYNPSIKEGLGYARAFIDGKVVTMHTLIIGKKEGLEVDHINHNGLDNRRKNLRHVTRRQNCLNRTYGCGVSYHKKTDTWYARITDKKGKRIGLGYHKTFEKAMEKRKEAELQLYPSFQFSKI